MATIRHSVAEISPRSGAPNVAGIPGALPMPIIVVGMRGELLYANQAAEQFFDMGVGLLLRQKLADLLEGQLRDV